MKHLCYSALLLFFLLSGIFSGIFGKYCLAQGVHPGDSLVAWYPLNGNANDQTGNGHHGIVNGAVLTADRFNDPGKAYFFDGLDDNIDCGDPPGNEFDLTEDFTFTAWINTASTPPGPGSNVCYSIVGKDVWNGPNEKKWIFGVQQNRLIYHINGPGYGAGFWIYSPEYTMLTSVWYHVALTKSDSLYSFYINGEFIGGAIDLNGIYDVDAPLTLGYSEPCSPFHGSLDDIRIYNRPLTSGEIQFAYSNGGLTAWYPFNGNADDESGNGLHGTVNGPVAASDRFGDGASAWYFDGENDQVSCPENNLVDIFTLSLWIKPLTEHEIDFELNGGVSGIWGQNYVIFPVYGDLPYGPGHAGVGISAGTNGISIYEHGDNYLPAVLVWQGDFYDWTHIALYYDLSGYPHLYVNGLHVRTGQNGQKAVHPNLGETGGGEYGSFNGKIDDIFLFDRILSDEEIHALYLEHAFEVSLKVFLEGPFNGSEMNTNLTTLISPAQPYNIAPWYYFGDEEVWNVVNSDIVDWVLVELRQTGGGASTALPSTVFARRAAFLLYDGTITSLNGYQPPAFFAEPTEDVYAVVWHRNHVGVMSANPLGFVNDGYEYDFSSGEGQVYGGSLGHKEIGPGIYGMTAADGDANLQVNNADKNEVWAVEAGTSGYMAGDFNLDNQVGNTDKIDMWMPNGGKGSQVPGGLPDNLPPEMPYDPLPSDGSTGIALDTAISWSCSDPDGDPLEFDVYFGSQDPPPMVFSGSTDTLFNPGQLEFSILYYWKIVAFDNSGHCTVSPIWSFFTLANQSPVLPYDPAPPDGAVNVGIDTSLYWSCYDPENDSLRYNVYFSTINPPGLVSQSQSDTVFNPGTLAYNTTYYWQIEAVDSYENHTIGQIWSFTTEPQPWLCGDALIDPRDGQSYNTVKIGLQCWMAENINIGTMISGTSSQTNNGIIEKYCYGNNTANCNYAGGWYEWHEMMQYSTTPGVVGICPPGGWHLPTDGEYCTLEQAVDPTISCSATGDRGVDGGTKLKAGGGSGFEALMAGYRNTGGNFYNMGIETYFWTSSQNSGQAWYRKLSNGNPKVNRYFGNTSNGYSVRCVMEAP